MDGTKQLTRRHSLQLLAAAPALLSLESGRTMAQEPKAGKSLEQFLRAAAVPTDWIDQFLSGRGWDTYDAELGFVQGEYFSVGPPNPSELPWRGIGGSAVLYTKQANGARTSLMYSWQRPRINTYGNSFTHCNQVNDGETWQEYLAGHLCEPIGNFGVGGYGVFQAYLRMLREEETDSAAKYLIFFIWGDDHFRSMYPDRAPFSPRRGIPFFRNPYPYIEMELETGRYMEREPLLKTPDSLYKLADPQWMVDHLKNNLAVQLNAFQQGLTNELDRARITKLAKWLDFPFNWNAKFETNRERTDTIALGQYGHQLLHGGDGSLQAQAGALLDRYALRASQFLLGKIKSFVNATGKELLIVLFDSTRLLLMGEMLHGGSRYDQELVDYLKRENISYFDMNEVHIRDFARYNLTWEEYLKQFLVTLPGHYTPQGNHFFAHAIRDKVIAWLDPKPLPYRGQLNSVNFNEYRPNTRIGCSIPNRSEF